MHCYWFLIPLGDEQAKKRDVKATPSTEDSSVSDLSRQSSEASEYSSDDDSVDSFSLTAIYQTFKAEITGDYSHLSFPREDATPQISFSSPQSSKTGQRQSQSNERRRLMYSAPRIKSPNKTDDVNMYSNSSFTKTGEQFVKTRRGRGADAYKESIHGAVNNQRDLKDIATTPTTIQSMRSLSSSTPSDLSRAQGVLNVKPYFIQEPSPPLQLDDAIETKSSHRTPIDNACGETPFDEIDFFRLGFGQGQARVAQRLGVGKRALRRSSCKAALSHHCRHIAKDHLARRAITVADRMATAEQLVASPERRIDASRRVSEEGPFDELASVPKLGCSLFPSPTARKPLHQTSKASTAQLQTQRGLTRSESY